MRSVHSQPRKRSRRGAAMVEFCFAVPILAFIVSMIFLFGWGESNAHRVRTAARHKAWSHLTRSGGGPEDWYNRAFYASKAHGVSFSHAAGPHQTLDAFVDEVGTYTGPGFELASELRDRWLPRGHRVSAVATFPGYARSWERFAGTTRAAFLLEGRPWIRQEVSVGRAAREMYLSDLDLTLRAVPPPGSDLAEVIRGLYHAGW